MTFSVLICSMLTLATRPVCMELGCAHGLVFASRTRCSICKTGTEVWRHSAQTSGCTSFALELLVRAFGDFMEALVVDLRGSICLGFQLLGVRCRADLSAMWGMLQCCPWRPGVHGSQMLNSNDSILPSLVGYWLASPELILNVAALHRETAMNNASAVMTAAEEDASRAQCNDSCPLAAHSRRLPCRCEAEWSHHVRSSCLHVAKLSAIPSLRSWNASRMA